MILIVASEKDIASVNISRQILRRYAFALLPEMFQGSPSYVTEVNGRSIKLVMLQNELIYAQDLTDFFEEVELIVFVSRHSSVSGMPTLSVHTPGNLGQADFGGIPRTVSVAPANAMREALRALVKCRDEMRIDYEVSYECTHHGPSLNVPTMFVELGSSVKQWEDLQAAEAVATAVIEAVSRFGDHAAKTVIGIGGPHYSSKFTRMALEEELAFGHIIPKYAVPVIDSEILSQCIERTFEDVDSILLEWKGIRGEDKPSLMKILAELKILPKKV